MYLLKKIPNGGGGFTNKRFFTSFVKIDSANTTKMQKRDLPMNLMLTLFKVRDFYNETLKGQIPTNNNDISPPLYNNFNYIDSSKYRSPGN